MYVIFLENKENPDIIQIYLTSNTRKSLMAVLHSIIFLLIFLTNCFSMDKHIQMAEVGEQTLLLDQSIPYHQTEKTGDCQVLNVPEVTNDVWAEIIFPFLTLEDYARLSGVSKYFYTLLRGGKYICGHILSVMVLSRTLTNLVDQIKPIMKEWEQSSPDRRLLLYPEEERDVLFELVTTADLLQLTEASMQVKIKTLPERDLQLNEFDIRQGQDKLSKIYQMLREGNIIQKVRTHYATKNRALYEPSGFESILIDPEGDQPLKTTCSSFFLRLTKSKCLMVSAAAAISVGLIAGGFIFPKPNFEELGNLAGQEAFNQMMNTTYLYVDDLAGFYDGYSPSLFEDCLHSGVGTQYQTNLSLFYNGQDGYTYGREMIFTPGTIKDWILFVQSRCGCALDYWEAYVNKLINGTKGNGVPPNPHNMVCSPNPNKSSTICCGNVWNREASRQFKYPWNCFGTYCLRMIQGNAERAYSETRETTIYAAQLQYFLIFSAIEAWGVAGGLLMLGLMGCSYHYYF